MRADGISPRTSLQKIQSTDSPPLSAFNKYIAPGTRVRVASRLPPPASRLKVLAQPLERPGVDDLLGAGPAAPGRQDAQLDPAQVVRVVGVAIDRELDAHAQRLAHVAGVQVEPVRARVDLQDH